MRKSLKKLCGLFLTIILSVSVVFIPNDTAIAASTITGNNSMSSAYNYGSWTRINSNSATIILEAGQHESWSKFTVNPGEHIYIRSSYKSNYAGEWFEIRNGLGNTVGVPQFTPDNVYNPSAISPSIYLDCDNNSSTAGTYYLVLHRGTVSIDNNIYYSITAYNRIRTNSIQQNISGTASNPGGGADSTTISVNLSSSSNVLNNAIVTSISTSASQNPSQGNVHHMIMPNSNGIWYVSRISGSSSGSYSISVDDNIPVKQTWSFKYNAAGGKSTMRNVKLFINYQYDLHDTNYVIFVR